MSACPCGTLQLSAATFTKIKISVKLMKYQELLIYFKNVVSSTDLKKFYKLSPHGASWCYVFFNDHMTSQSQ